VQKNIGGKNSKNMPQCKILFKYLTLLALSIFALNCGLKKHSQTQKMSPGKPAERAVNINRANLKELKKIPFIGQKNAQKIILHRKKFGEFRRVEHIMLIDGISERHFRKIHGLIKVK
jgi:competence protein ComEA